jgi:hypothetical protein
VFGCVLFVQEHTISSFVRRHVKLKKIDLKLNVAMKKVNYVRWQQNMLGLRKRKFPLQKWLHIKFDKDRVEVYEENEGQT